MYFFDLNLIVQKRLHEINKKNNFQKYFECQIPVLNIYCLIDNYFNFTKIVQKMFEFSLRGQKYDNGRIIILHPTFLLINKAIIVAIQGI